MPGELAAPNPRLDAVYDVILDDLGCFNYILCRVYLPEDQHVYKYIVRGFIQAEFHADIYDEVDSQLEQAGVVCECVGGGVIYHDAERQIIDIYGTSQGYGKANHGMTADLLKWRFPYYTRITWAD